MNENKLIKEKIINNLSDLIFIYLNKFFYNNIIKIKTIYLFYNKKYNK